MAQLAAEFAEPFDASDIAYLCGLLHDIGKYSKGFQERLEGSPLKVDHSTAGAKEAVKLYGNLWGKLLSYFIIGHHGGLPDWEDGSYSCLKARLNKNEIEEYIHWTDEVMPMLEGKKPWIKFKPEASIKEFQLANKMRMIFSCIVDADYLDTEKAIGRVNAQARIRSTDLSDLKPLLDERIMEIVGYAKDNNINRMRKEILEQCINMANSEQGMFTLTVPTGGGKTLSSLAFAMNHAIRNGMKRVIYVIPYTSIIEQNAKVFRDIFGDQIILEHHSNYSFDDLADSESETQILHNLGIRLATQNWDVPIVITTNVQFFESFFSNRTSKCRKLHNIANSVIIFDEAQMLPLDYLKPCMALLSDLVLNFKSSIVLCTATQPALKAFIPERIHVTEIMKSPELLYDQFKRVKVNYLSDEMLNDDILTKEIKKYNQVLCIVNTRRHAFELISKLSAEPGVYHLSARMCPVHRSDKITQIKAALKTGSVCRVISTQLIEAGVDVDFPIVYRSIAGLDSIAQSAGRCNREGLLSEGFVYVFEPEKYGIPKGYLGLAASKAKMIFRSFPNDPLKIDAIHAYFESLYETQDELLDSKGIMKLHKESADKIQFPFRTIAENFKLIENGMESLVVAYNSKQEIEGLINAIRFAEYPGSYIKELQKYTILIYPYEMRMLRELGVVENIDDKVNVLRDLDLYTDLYGLRIPGREEIVSEVLIF